MITLVRTVIEGYRVLLGRIFRMVLFLALLAFIGAAIATPVWLIASSAPRVLNWLFLLLCVLLATMIIRGRRRPRPTRPAADTAILTRVFPGVVTVAAAGMIVVGLASRAVPLLVGGVAILSLGLAWYLGR